jgi:hypothetical protein
MSEYVFRALRYVFDLMCEVSWAIGRLNSLRDRGLYG